MARGGAIKVGGSWIPQEFDKLVWVKRPDGSKVAYLTAVVHGVRVYSHVGGGRVVNELFGSPDNFPSVVTISGNKFDSILSRPGGGHIIGEVDEHLNATESLTSEIDREIALALGEAPPKWARKNKEVMSIMVLGTTEEWSADKINNALSKTKAFQNRYSAFDTVKGRMGDATVSEVIAEMHKEEAALRGYLRTYRGVETAVGPAALNKYLSSGWTADQMGEVLPLEQYLRNNPTSWRSLNNVMQAQGLKGLTNLSDVLSVMTSQAAPEVYEGITDFYRQQAFKIAGIGVSAGFAASLGGGESQGVASLETFQEAANLTAYDLDANLLELAKEKFGLTKEEILAARFGKPDTAAKIGANRQRSAAEVEAILQQLQRERDQAALGYSHSQGYADREGQLVIQGLEGL